MSPRFSLSAVPTSRRATVSTYTTGFCRCSCAKAKFAFPTYRNQQNRWISKAPKSAWPRSLDDFSLENVKSSSFAKAHIIYGTGGQLKRSTSAEYFACAKAFALAVENGSNPAATYLLDHPEFDAALIYETACILMTLHGVSRWFGIAMFASASGLGFTPATLDGIQYLIAERKFGKVSAMSKFEADFRRLVTQGKDPNALALEGTRLTTENRLSQAETMFRRALKLGGANFSYKWMAQRGLGYVLHTQNAQSEEARHLFEEVYTTHPLDVARELSQMYQSSQQPERARDVLFRLALHKDPSAYDRLAELELGLAWDAPNASQKKDHETWAMEFQRLRTLGGRSQVS